MAGKAGRACDANSLSANAGKGGIVEGPLFRPEPAYARQVNGVEDDESDNFVAK